MIVVEALHWLQLDREHAAEASKATSPLHYDRQTKLRLRRVSALFVAGLEAFGAGYV
jgi:hypothetical protein